MKKQPRQYNIGSLFVIGFAILFGKNLLADNTPTTKVAPPQLTQALQQEKKITSFAFDNTLNYLNVGVKSDGTSRDGYAMYVCEVLREHNVTGVYVRVVNDFNHKSMEVLGSHQC